MHHRSSARLIRTSATVLSEAKNFLLACAGARSAVAAYIQLLALRPDKTTAVSWTFGRSSVAVLP